MAFTITEKRQSAEARLHLHCSHFSWATFAFAGETEGSGEDAEMEACSVHCTDQTGH